MSRIDELWASLSKPEQMFMAAARNLAHHQPQEAHPRDALRIIANVFFAVLYEYNRDAGIDPDGELTYEVVDADGIWRTLTIEPKSEGEPA